MGYVRTNIGRMPRVKADSDRGYIGAWMRRERTRPDRDWSPEQVVERLPAGRKIRSDYYRQLESGSGGKHPGPELLAALAELYGSWPQVPLERPQTDDDLAGAIRAQTEAMLALVVELREARESQQGRDEGLAAVLGRFAGTLEQLRLVPDGKPR